MKGTRILFAVALAIAMAGSGALAATTMWLTTDAGGAMMPSNSVTVPANGSVTLHCFIDSSDIGNTFEIMVGYDTSDATTYGANKGTWQDGNLALLSGQAAVEATIPASFGVLRSAVLVASGRENPNAQLGGRPYGFVARGATTANAAPGKVKLFSFELNNQMQNVNDSSYVVVSNLQGGNSYSSAWKYGTALREASYGLNIVTGEGQELPVVGVTNKAVFDAIVQSAAPNYKWVLWGEVKSVGTGSFVIDDGSGVTITVVSTDTVSQGQTVSARGTLSNINATAKTATLTADSVTIH